MSVTAHKTYATKDTVVAWFLVCNDTEYNRSVAIIASLMCWKTTAAWNKHSKYKVSAPQPTDIFGGGKMM